MMEDSNEQTIVINDLLSSLSCNIALIPKEKLLKSFREFYAEKEIKESHKTLLASLPVKKSTRHGRRVKNPDPLIAIYDCFQLVPSEDMPVFVCKDLNNVPEIDIVKVEPEDVDYDFNESMESEGTEISDLFLEEQQSIKAQINDIASVVEQLKNELSNITNKNSADSDAKLAKKSVEDFLLQEKRKKLSSQKSSISFEKKKKGLAYLQSLIDEDEGKAEDDVLDNEYDDEYTVLELEHLEDENESNPEAEYSEVYIKRELDDSLETSTRKISRSGKLGNGDIGSKVILIKNEDEENSIEIASSSDYFLGFDEDDPTDNIIALEFNEDDDFKGEIELLVNDDKCANNSKEANVLRSCSICGELFSTQKRLDIHVKTHCVKKIFDCILCDEGFLSKEQLRNHFEECLEVTKKKYNLDAFPCPTCGRLYAQERALKQHSYMHSESRPFGCNQCTYRYLTKNSLEAHIKTQHNVMNKFFCPFCDNSYISVGFLKNHIRSHTGERPFGCKECGYKASTADLLKRHNLTHGPPKEFKCDICDFTCIGIGKLSRHKAREHKREHIFCTICGKEFNNSCVYHKHYLSHVGARPYPCSICAYAAISREVLMVHMRTHTGDNIINCPNCSVPFGTKYSLKRHLKSYCINRSSYYGTEYVVQ